MSTSHHDDTPADPRPSTPRELQQVILAERTQAPFLLHRGAERELVVTALAERKELLVGRDGQCDMVLDWDRRVSGVHCRLVAHASEWLVEDPGLSRNGTFVNGMRVSSRRRLRDTDVLRVGETVLRFRDPGDAKLDPTEIVADQRDEVGRLSDAQRRVLVALCRPLYEGRSSIPASNPEIAAEVFLGAGAVKWHLRQLFQRFDLVSLPQNEKRTRLAELALQWELVTERDLER